MIACSRSRKRRRSAASAASSSPSARAAGEKPAVVLGGQRLVGGERFEAGHAGAEMLPAEQLPDPRARRLGKDRLPGRLPKPIVDVRQAGGAVAQASVDDAALRNRAA